MPAPSSVTPFAAPAATMPETVSSAVPEDMTPEDMARALRDLFAARDGNGLARALERLDGGAAGGEASDRATFSVEAEYAFNRLFVGPGHVPAPPYASVYLDAEPLLMGRATASMRELFRSLGLAVREEDNLPEDHLACELEAWLVLRTLARAEPLRQNAEEALAWLVDRHMQRWIPAFLRQARAEPMPEALSGALNRLEAWLAAAHDELTRA